MTYPPSNPGYPPPNPQSGSQFDATQQFAKAVPTPAPAAPAAAPAAAQPGENKLPEILLAVVAIAGLLIYFVSFALDASTSQGMVVLVALPLLAGLLAGVSLLPKQNKYTGVVAAIATIPFLFVIGAVVSSGGSADWTIWVLLVLTLVQAGAAITALLFEAGIITPPAPKPQFDQQPQYGQYGGPSQYYGQQHQPQHGGQQYQQAQPQQPGYPSQYGGYSSGPNTGGYPVQSPQGQQGQQPSGPPTPPTGYPTYGQPQQSAPSGAPAQQPPSQQSGPAPS
ncbi:DUF5336 domain-containing protein [Mycolicibacterium peregrinum]|uniref:Antigen n=1 Tax=Mycolicibacterium peregrinum TaxID=43304 RepID=A0A1X2ATJ8_MYCPR|nr:DUF5336 domain-containing protein [Mycolicibacterium peregrinum]MCV7205361.1 DUF5336 domain-containing protein [Mycolicibacterium peregrinum]ORW54748.1 hypothetical protein AWC21_23665 [Mycolicibacterium peregrinum]TGB36413.1 hypothetical protein EJD98_29180 [Mycolicibacterium peregrinum]TGB37086.1 hypothetical protein EJD94_27880 [Mycolicibacterium peregrinum]